LLGLDNYSLSIGILVCIWTLMAVGLNIISGYAGQANLGHSAFYGFGAYTTALLTTSLGWPWFITMPLAIIVSAAVGVLLGLPSLRFQEDFLAIVTLGLGLVFQSVALYLPITGAALGIGSIPYPNIGSYTFDIPAFFLLALLLAVCGILVSIWLSHTWIGLGWRALRDDQLAANAMGINVTLLKVLAFSIGAGYAGLAGALLAHDLGFIIAYNFGFNETITALAMVVIGGMGTVYGAVLGAVLLTLIPEVVRPLQDYRLMIYGALIVIMMVFQPSGLLGDRSWVVRWWRARRG
jgi:branched-chain amino acid transport system permease protein